MKMEKVLSWVLLGLGGAAITIIQQMVTNAEIKSQVEEQLKEEYKND